MSKCNDGRVDQQTTCTISYILYRVYSSSFEGNDSGEVYESSMNV